MRALFLVDGLAALGFGLAFVIAPLFSLALLGIRADPAHVLLARLLGASLLGYAGLMLLARNGDRPTLRSVVRGQLAFDAVGTAVAAYGAVSGAANTLLWGIAAALASLAVVRTYLSLR